MDAALLTLEKHWRPNIVMESKFGTDGIHIFLTELVFRPINHCTGKQVSSETTEKPIRGAGKNDYFGWGWIKVVFNFSKSQDKGSALAISLEAMIGLDIWPNSRHDGASHLDYNAKRIPHISLLAVARLAAGAKDKPQYS